MAENKRGQDVNERRNGDGPVGLSSESEVPERSFELKVAMRLKPDFPGQNKIAEGRLKVPSSVSVAI